MSVADFQKTVLDYYQQNARDLPWRNLSDNLEQRFYEVFVSEVMLQQTQVPRVIIKYEEWMNAFPTLSSAVSASYGDMLTFWQGLGYNRRARYMHDALTTLHKSATLPSSVEDLVKYPGIGTNTAGAILTYCYNVPVAYVETNIRTVYLYHFPELSEGGAVDDSAILQAVKDTLFTQDPRTWYWALMDYGSYLKAQGFKNHSSKQYKKQSRFKGSSRQLRANIVKELLIVESCSEEYVIQKFNDVRVTAALQSLYKDKTLHFDGHIISVSQ